MNNIAERRAALLHAAAQVAHHVTSILDLDQLLNKTVDVICDEFGFYYAGVFLLDKTGGWAILRAARGEAGAKMIAPSRGVGGFSVDPPAQTAPSLSLPGPTISMCQTSLGSAKTSASRIA